MLSGPAGKTLLIFLLFLVFTPFSGKTYAADRMEADQLTYENGIYTFLGSVFFQKEDVTAHGDRATFNEKTSELYLKGNVSYEDTGIILKADEALFNLKNKTGSATNAEIFVKQGGYYVKGEKVQKLNETDYKFQKAQFTTCDSPKPAWTIRSNEMDVVMGKGLGAKNVTLRIKDKIPVFYSPYLTAPIQEKRHTGFLQPTVGVSQFSGINTSLPFYWAMAENMDMTFTLDYHSDRAYGESTEFRYIEPGGYNGSMRLGFLRDWKDDKDYVNFTGFDVAPFGFIDFNLLNHVDFYRLYNLSIQERAQRFLETKSEAFFRKSEDGKVYLVTRYFEDTLPGVDQDAVIQRLPQAGFMIYPIKRGPFVFTADTSVSNFWRSAGPWGERLTAVPGASYSVGNSVNFFQSANVEARAYDLYQPNQDLTQAVFNYEASLRTRLSKSYGRTTHFLEPTFSFYYRSLSGDSPSVVFDSFELERQSQIIEASILNRFYREGSEFILVKATEQFDMKADSFQPIDLNISMVKPISARASLRFDPNISSIQKADLESSFSPFKNTSIRLRENYSRPDQTWTHSIGLTLIPLKNVTWETDMWYDSRGAGLRDLKTTVNYLTQCWGVKFIASKRPNDFSFYIQLEMPGFGMPAARTSPS